MPKNLVGLKFGYWLVSNGPEYKCNGNACWLCRCICGTTRFLTSQVLRNGDSRSCGCKTRELRYASLQDRLVGEGIITDLAGERFGRLIVIKQLPRKNDQYGNWQRIQWLCQCDCGKQCVAIRGALVGKTKQSCGCLAPDVHRIQIKAIHKKQIKHSMRHCAEYGVWAEMRKRCFNTKCESYPRYGGRGIKICKRWSKFENFFADMGKRPTCKHTLDRIDVNNDYKPSNCRWSTRKTQARNRRSNRLVRINNRTKPLVEWCEYFAMPYDIVLARILRGWPPKLSLTIPLGQTLKSAGVGKIKI